MTSELAGPRATGAISTAPSCTIEQTTLESEGHPIDLVTLRNGSGMEVRFLTLGGIIVSIRVPDRSGQIDDVVLGYDALESYLDDAYYFGALVGRSANRIGGGSLEIDGRTIQLSLNDGPNHIHGGVRGFNAVVWSVDPFVRADEAGATLSYRSVDGEEGYPGTLAVRVTYTLRGTGDLVVAYHAETDSATPVNMTQHAYFNLTGKPGRDVLGHVLTLNAAHFTPVGAGLIPTGELRRVDSTPFDFVSPHTIGARIHSADAQLELGGGYDHNFVLARAARSTPTMAARLHDPESGRVLEVLTTEPGLQVCSGNALHVGVRGKAGHEYGQHCGVALETQHFPDAPNHPEFPTTIVRPNERYQSETIYRFSVAAL